jgi:hypothetical protein
MQVRTWKVWKRWLGVRKGAIVRIPRPINPVLATISLAVQRVYGSLDNPYTSTITFLLTTWTLHKISMLGRSMGRWFSSTGCAADGSEEEKEEDGQSVPFKWASVLDIILDCTLVSKYLYVGVVIQASNDPTVTAVQALQGLLAAVTLNRALIAVHYPCREET